MAKFTNQATLSYANGTIKSNIITGQLLAVLTAAKTSVSATYTSGGSITYIISIVNAGTSSFSNVTVTDNLGAYTFGANQIVPLDYVTGTVHYFVNGVLQSPPPVITGPPLVFSPIAIPAGGSVMLIYEAALNAAAPLQLGGSITNTATISGTGIATPIYVSNTVTVVSAASLTITKSLTPTTVIENDTLTYTFIIQNSGNIDVTAADNLIITDLFDPILKNITVEYEGNPLSLNTGYTYNQATGLFNTVAGVITVPAAQFAQDASTGDFTVTPTVRVLTVKGTI